MSAASSSRRPERSIPSIRRMTRSWTSHMKEGISITMMTLSELWKHFHFLTERESIPEDKQSSLQEFLHGEYTLREQKRIASLLRMSGIKRVKLLHDFDWTFNPKIPREKLMEFLQT